MPPRLPAAGLLPLRLAFDRLPGCPERGGAARAYESEDRVSTVVMANARLACGEPSQGPVHPRAEPQQRGAPQGPTIGTPETPSRLMG